MEKDFIGWHAVKEELNDGRVEPSFQERQIWWCSVGVNVGHEADGKHDHATRPVLIVRKFNSHIFFGAPLTTRIKENPYYYPIDFHGRRQCVMLSQLRLWSAKRLRSRMGYLSVKQFAGVKEALRDLLT